MCRSHFDVSRLDAQPRMSSYAVLERKHEMKQCNLPFRAVFIHERLLRSLDLRRSEGEGFQFTLVQTVAFTTPEEVASTAPCCVPYRS